jgi:ESCRT-I complex subunit VPS37
MMKTLELRRKQIDSLKVFNENVIERKFNEIYEVDFTLKLGKSKIEAKIIIFLPQKFPEDEKPKLFVQPALAHNYLNKHGEVVNFPGLSNFTVHSEIGRISNVLISDFQKNPPALLATSQQNSSIFHDFDLRKELDGLAVDQLQDLLRDPVYFDDFVEETRIVKSHNNALEALFDEVEILSRGLKFLIITNQY